MVDMSNSKDKGLRSVLRDRDNSDAGKDLDNFTVFQDIQDTNLDHKVYEVDRIASGHEESIASNPMIAMKDQDYNPALIADEQNSVPRTQESAVSREDDKDVAVRLSDSLSGTTLEQGTGLSGAQGQILKSSLDTDQRAETIGDVRSDNSLTNVDPLQLDNSVQALDGAVSVENNVNAVFDEVSDDVMTEENQDDDLIDESVDDEQEDDIVDEGNSDSGDVPEFLIPNLNVRVSNATDNQTTINSDNGFDLYPIAYGESRTITGADMDIPGVRDSAQITYVFADENTLEVTLDSAWNSIKNIEVSSESNGNVTLNNFVHTDVNLGEGGDSSVVINGAKRGNITTAGGDDSVEVNAQTNNAGWSNNFDIDTGAGNDIIELIGDKGHTGFKVDAGAGNDNVIIGDAYDASDVNLGAGDDNFTGGDGDDIVEGGSGNDTISGGGGTDILKGGAGDDTLKGGSGDDTLEGGEGKDTYIITSNDGNVTITDFGGVGGGGRGEAALMPEHDTIKLEGEALTAENMLLDYDGQDTVVTFEGVDNFSITLENFDFTDLDNLPAVEGWNILFDGQTEGSDAYDVFNNHSALQHNIWNKDSVTFLNNADNTVNGKDGSDDVINAMDGDDVIDGKGGNDTLRGGDGDDRLIGGAGDDRLDGGNHTDIAVFSGDHAEYQITFNEDESITITDTVEGRDGSDTLLGIERVEFRDGEVDATPEALILPAVGEDDDTQSDDDDQEDEVLDENDDDVTDSQDEEDDVVDEDQDDENDDASDDDDVVDETDDGNNGHGNDDGVDDSNPGQGNDNQGNGNGPGNNNGHGNNLDGVDDDNPGQGQGGPNAGKDDNGDEDEGALGNQDDETPGADPNPEDDGQGSNEGITLDGGNGKDTLIGTDGDDIISGGNGKDNITGGGGDDTIYGGNGKDTAHYSGDFSEYNISQNDDGSYTIQDTVAGRDGADTVYETEFFDFNDGTQEAGSESWLAAVEAGDENALVDAQGGDDNNWLAEVEADAENVDAQNEDNEGIEAQAPVDLADITPDGADQVDDAGGIV